MKSLEFQVQNWLQMAAELVSSSSTRALGSNAEKPARLYWSVMIPFKDENSQCYVLLDWTKK